MLWPSLQVMSKCSSVFSSPADELVSGCQGEQQRSVGIFNLQALWVSLDFHPFGDEGEEEKEEEFEFTSLWLQLPNMHRVIIRKEKFVCASTETRAMI